MSPERESHRRARLLIEALGAEQSAWPDAERQAVLSALAESDGLKVLHTQEQTLDEWLNQSAVTASLDAQAVALQISQSYAQKPALEARLGAAFERIADLFAFGSWRSPVAASVTLSVGVALGTMAYVPSEDWSNAEQYSFTVIGEE
ncbi:hypothetical protein N9W66_01130 [Luminiphilus sp.]|nr:hypothetical protein [Luminiphilus sp.]